MHTSSPFFVNHRHHLGVSQKHQGDLWISCFYERARNASPSKFSYVNPTTQIQTICLNKNLLLKFLNRKCLAFVTFQWPSKGIKGRHFESRGFSCPKNRWRTRLTNIARSRLSSSLRQHRNCPCQRPRWIIGPKQYATHLAKTMQNTNTRTHTYTNKMKSTHIHTDANSKPHTHKHKILYSSKVIELEWNNDGWTEWNTLHFILSKKIQVRLPRCSCLRWQDKPLQIADRNVKLLSYNASKWNEMGMTWGYVSLRGLVIVGIILYKYLYLYIDITTI